MVTAPVVMALVHWNSWDMGFRKIPKKWPLNPTRTMVMVKTTATMYHP